jgi:hypothetical protein
MRRMHHELLEGHRITAMRGLSRNRELLRMFL